jgi:hypothetical protein
MEMHEVAQNFIMEMSSWIDAFYQELVSTSDATEEEAWEVVGACIKKVFEVMRVPRAQAANATMDSDPKSQCATYLWALVQAHRIMREFLEARFQNHGAIAPVIVLHIFKTRVTRSALTSNIKRLEGRIASLEKGKEHKKSLLQEADGEAHNMTSAQVMRVHKRDLTEVFETVVQRDYSKYGVTVGRVTNVEGAVACGYVCAGWPSWALAAELRGWRIIVIVIRDSPWESRIRGLFPGALIAKGEDVQSLGCKVQLGVWFCDVEPLRGMRIFGDDPHSQVMIFSLRRFRQPCPGSHAYQRVVLSHSDCGGVTNGMWTIHIYRLKNWGE